MGLDPVTIGLVGVSAAVSAVGTYQRHKAQKEASQAAERAERANALVLQEQAELELLQSQREAELFQEESRMFMGQQTLAFAKAGVDMTGSAAHTLVASEQAAFRSRRDILEYGQRRHELTLMGANQAVRNAEGIRRVRPLQQTATILGGVTDLVNIGASTLDMSQRARRDV